MKRLTSHTKLWLLSFLCSCALRPSRSESSYSSVFDHDSSSCYALRNPDLLKQFCQGQIDECDHKGLAEHYRLYGRSEGLIYTCNPAEYESIQDSPTRVLSGDRESSATLTLESRPLMMIHIPKTSGASFMNEITWNSVQPGANKGGGHICYEDALPQATMQNRMTTTFLREPRSHVLSQFLHCRYDNNARIIQSKDFPAEDSPQLTFEAWLRHFVSLNSSQFGPDYDFNCMDPRNMMTRIFSCHGVGGRLRVFHHQRDEVDIDRALANLQVLTFLLLCAKKYETYPDLLSVFNVTLIPILQRIDSLGLTEYYAESLCLMQLENTGDLPRTCTCDWNHTQNHEHIIHRKEGLKSKYSLTPEAVKMADEITQFDRVLYRAGVDRFMRAYQNKTRNTALCPVTPKQ